MSRSSGRPRPNRGRGAAGRPASRPAARRREPLPPPITSRESRRRIRILGVCMLVGVGGIAARAGYLGFVQRGDLSALAADQRVHTVDLPGARGLVYDRQGRELAGNRPMARVEVSPNLIADPRATAARLAPAVGMPAAQVTAKISGTGTWAMLAPQISHSAGARIRAMKLTGVYVTDTTTRVQTLGPATAQLMGLVDADGRAHGGIEGQYDKDLHGVAGARVEARDPRQDTLKVLTQTDPTPGRDVVSTLDMPIQNRAYEVAAETARTYDAKSATIVVTTVDGRVLAMATAPSFDPNKRSTYTPELALNRATAASFEPGSTFKVVTIAGAIQTKEVTPRTSFYLPVSLDIDKELDRTLSDAHERGPETATVADILKRSSNVGTVLIARDRLGPERVNNWIYRFGFGRPTGIGLSEESGSILPTSKWSGGSIYNIPIGQGDAVTQMQLTQAYGAIANGGVLTTPRIVQSIGGEAVPPGPTRRVMTRSTATALTDMLRGVVSADGTGSEANIPGYEVAGKTGTAQKIDPKTGLYSDTAFSASFVGFVPANRPQIVVSVVVDEPGGAAHQGGVVAAPAFEKIAKFCLWRLGIPKD